MASFGRQFGFHDVIRLVTLTVAVVTSFLQLLEVQNLRKICVSVQKRVREYFLSFCVLESKYILTVSDLLLKIYHCMSVSLK